MLTSLQNPLVKQIRKLHTAKERREQQLFLLEGTHLLEEAIAVDYPLVTVCCTLEWQERHPRLWNSICQRSPRTALVSPEVLKAVATTIQPDGVVATAPRSNRAQSLAVTGLGLYWKQYKIPATWGQ
jgi:TrmH family RNA methyltransferase